MATIQFLPNKYNIVSITQHAELLEAQNYTALATQYPLLYTS